jgi:hypothetical protein
MALRGGFLKKSVHLANGGKVPKLSPALLSVQNSTLTTSILAQGEC